jgi:hypothetical protein
MSFPDPAAVFPSPADIFGMKKPAVLAGFCSSEGE